MKTLLKYLTLAASLAAFAVSVRAVPTLVLYDPHSNALVYVQDLGAHVLAANEGQDTLPGTNGYISWSGQVGEWFINVTTGLVTNAGAQPIIDLNSINTSAHTNGANVGSNIVGDAGSWAYSNLQISLVADGMTLNPAGAGVKDSIGGTSGGDLYYSDWVGYGSYIGGSAFTTLVDDQGPFGPGAFHSDTSGWIPPGGYTTVSVVVDIAHYGDHTFKTTSFDIEKRVPDTSMTALLLGMGLLGVGLAARRLKA